jgi:hypothetical protein
MLAANDHNHVQAGTYSEAASAALKGGLESFRKLQDVPEADAVRAATQAGRCLLELAEGVADQLAALREVLQLAKSKYTLGRYPADEAHWIIARAHNLGCLSVKGRSHQDARAFKEAALEISKATNCSIITPDICQKALADLEE